MSKTKEGIEVKVGQVWQRNDSKIQIINVDQPRRILVKIIEGALIGAGVIYSRAFIRNEFTLIPDNK